MNDTTTRTNPRLTIYLAMATFLILASLTNVLAKDLVHRQAPLFIAFWRIIISVFGLGLALRLMGRKIVLQPVDRWRFFMLGVLVVLGNQMFYIIAIPYTTATHAALLYGTTPAWVLIMAVWLGMEKIRGWKVAGITLSMVGVGIVLVGQGLNFTGDFLRGDLLLLVAVLAFSAYTTLGKPLVERYGALESTFLALAFGMILFIPIGLPAALATDYSKVTLQDWAMIFFFGLVTSGVVYGIWYWLVGRMRPTQVAVVMCAQPPTTFLMAAVMQGEQLTTALIVGGLITVFGILLTVIGGGEKRSMEFKPRTGPVDLGGAD